MPNYCVNKNPQPDSGDHEVHDVASIKGCLPLEVNRISLGYHASCVGAVIQAKQFHYSNSDGCARCSPACHTS